MSIPATAGGAVVFNLVISQQPEGEGNREGSDIVVVDEVGTWGVSMHLDIARRLIGLHLDRFTPDNPEEL